MANSRKSLKKVLAAACVSGLGLTALAALAAMLDLVPRAGVGPRPVLPPPSRSQVGISTVVGWRNGEAPNAPQGFRVERFASELPTPRNLYQLPNGDVLVAEAEGGNRIELFRGRKADGTFEQRSVFADDLNRPFGMLLLGDYFYVANTDAILRFPYKTGQTRLQGAGVKILSLPSGGHWTRNLVASADGRKIYVMVGSASNVAESGISAERRRADVLEINPDGSGERIFANGLRNPVGAAIEPVSKKLWTVVNERDALGDDLVPDYLTEVRERAFYGWPYFYWGAHEDPRWKGKIPSGTPSPVVPDFALGSHSAALGLAFYTGSSFPQKFRGGAFVGLHGSWNSSVLRGYSVYFVPFLNGRPSDLGEVFLGGFVADPVKMSVRGRPVNLLVLPAGELLVADDVGGIIWQVRWQG